MNFCYVLTGDQPRYRRMLEASLTSLRFQHPTARVHLWVFPQDLGLTPTITGQVDQIHQPVVIGVKNAMEASRFIKIRMRRWIDDPFVFLDSDTLVLESLEPLFRSTAVSAVQDRIYQHPRPPCWPRWTLKLYRNLGWPVDSKSYFNSGVTIWPDSEVAGRLSESWHWKWTESRRLGVALDQPAFNSANHEMGGVVARLPDRFNAMIDADPRLTVGAHVVHFFRTGRHRFGPGLLDQLGSHQTVSRESVDETLTRIRQTGWPFDSVPWSRSRLGISFFLRASRQAMVRAVGSVFGNR